jgi:hypothetical protein
MFAWDQIFTWLISAVEYHNSNVNLQFIFQVACVDSQVKAIVEMRLNLTVFGKSNIVQDN